MDEKRYSLKHPYLSVKTPGECSYGGSQEWSKSHTMRKYGCGVVGIADLLLYLGLHHPSCETDLHHGILREDGYISYARYERYLMKMRRRYLHVIPGFGVPGWYLPFALNRYFRRYRLDLRASWGLRLRPMLPRIEAMLEDDIPVILAIGPNFPCVWGKTKLSFYRQVNGECVPATETKAHFVVVTGIWGNYLQVSSWGREYYISWPEYQAYVRKRSSILASNICRVHEKHRRGAKS